MTASLRSSARAGRTLALAAALALIGSCGALGAGFTVSGRLVDAASVPMAGIAVSLEGSGLPSATTGSDGSFRFDSAPCGSFSISALSPGKVFSLRRDATDAMDDGPVVSTYEGDVSGLELVGVDADKVTVPMVQGSGLVSPFEGQTVSGLRGVVTMVTRRYAHPIYDTTQTDGSLSAQWQSEDGFYMEATGSDKDGDPLTSDGVFVCAHNPLYDESKWLDSVPTDIVVGDVVVVSGVVREHRPADRFGNSAGYLTMTRIEETVAVHALSGSAPVNVGATAFPAGVLMTYESAPVLPAGVTEFRTMPWQEEGRYSILRAIRILESVEGMMVRVDTPLVTGCTYYNVTGILADDGKLGGVDNADLNRLWGGIAISGGSDDAMDFNSELLFVDYQKPSWKTFDPIPQVGDHITDSTGARRLRGVVEYTADGLYMIRPLQSAGLSNGASSVPAQGWAFDAARTGWTGSQSWPEASFEALTSALVNGALKTWRIGASGDSAFRAAAEPAWTAEPDKHLTVGSYNMENYEGQGLTYTRYQDMANIIMNCMGSPDVLVCVEMGDDRISTIIYANQDASYSIPDGYTSAVANLRGLCAAIADSGGPTYDFREIAPEENRDGGEPGTNIRVAFLFNTARVSFIDRGFPSPTLAGEIAVNTMATTAGSCDTWPVPYTVSGTLAYPSPVMLLLAKTATAPFKSSIGLPSLTLSPGRLLGSAFSGSTRKPLAGEFIFLPTGTKFFVVAAHLGSKSGDTPIYGDRQPPNFGSDIRRISQGRGINAFVNQLLAIDPRAQVIVAGDMNDFQFGMAMQALKGQSSGRQILFSPSETLLDPKEQFSYVFRGNLQQIDHVFVSQSLLDLMGAAPVSPEHAREHVFIPHINSVFSKNNHVQTSDHDPIVVRLRVAQ